MNRKTLVYIFGLAMLSMALVACTGIDLGDIVRVKTPNSVQQTTGLPQALTLNEAESEYQAWFADTQRVGAHWKANIERSNEVRSLLSQLSLSALDDFGPTLAGVPVVGPALPALTGLAGLFLGAGRLRKEKESSFNKGLKEGRVAAPGVVTT